MKQKIAKLAINETREVSIDGWYHCVAHILPENEEVELFLKNTEYFENEIVELQKLETCKYYEADTKEYDFLVDMIKKHQFKKVK